MSKLDLVATPIAHLSGAEFLAVRGVEPGTEPERQSVSDNAHLLEAFLAADTVVVGAPMYNFALPTQLRAWLDLLAVPGKTFRYTETGAEGLLSGKKVIVASTRAGSTAKERHQRPLIIRTYLRTFFGFLGIREVTFVRAEGLGVGPEVRASAIEGALADVQRIAA